MMSDESKQSNEEDELIAHAKGLRIKAEALLDQDHVIRPMTGRAASLVTARAESPAAIVLSWVYICLLFGAILFGLAWAVGSLITGQHIWQSVAILVFFGGAIPSLMEDLGWYWAHRCRLYTAAETLLFAAHQLDRTVFCLVQERTHSMNAMRLAQVALLRNRPAKALEWGTVALDMSKKDHWVGKFYANCVLGQIHYSMGNGPQAHLYLKQSQQLFDYNIASAPLAALRDKLRRFAAVNLDLLGRVALHAADKQAAIGFFDASYTLRLQLMNRKPLAEAYREHSLGLIAFQDFQIDEAHQKFAKALALLPDNVNRDYEEQTLAVEICIDATAYGQSSEDLALQACDKLGKLQAQGLPPRLLELAAKPVGLLQQPSNDERAE